VAHGGALAFAVNGTLDHQDMQAIEAAKPIFRWLADHEQYYSGQTSAARVLLLGGSARSGRTYNLQNYRGMFRFLSEEHIPFAASDNMDWQGKRQFDLVVATDWAPKELETYVQQGGRAIVVSSHPPEFAVASVVRTWPNVEGYFRIRNHQLFPSLRNTQLVMLHGDYSEVEGDGSDSLTLVPPSMFGPPEKIHVDQVDTTKPGLVWRRLGKGQVAWIPWNLAALYYRHSLPAHAGVLRDVINRLLPERQLVTNAHPLVEVTVMRQGTRTLLHLVNLSGHSQTAYFRPLPIRGIDVSLAGKFKRAASVRNKAELPLRTTNTGSSFVLPELGDYELVVLE
jgi:hypothetical protein